MNCWSALLRFLVSVHHLLVLLLKPFAFRQIWSLFLYHLSVIFDTIWRRSLEPRLLLHVLLLVGFYNIWHRHMPRLYFILNRLLINAYPISMGWFIISIIEIISECFAHFMHNRLLILFVFERIIKVIIRGQNVVDAHLMRDDIFLRSNLLFERIL